MSTRSATVCRVQCDGCCPQSGTHSLVRLCPAWNVNCTPIASTCPLWSACCVIALSRESLPFGVLEAGKRQQRQVGRNAEESKWCGSFIVRFLKPRRPCVSTGEPFDNACIQHTPTYHSTSNQGRVGVVVGLTR
ncbi:unnamed protein product, partial [Ectocarpus sp. 12 AP-2014]